MENEYEYYQMTGWDNGIRQTPITEIIKATSLEQAIEIAENEYPKSSGYKWEIKEPLTPNVLARTE